eukprot:CAMPEP_0170485728 /NCGR_PEP_ID=MMETSP0208-20121228/4913_1 /TAXON_ID=197538 /ORGANISM="Strombidium inclinatum, Strain S3" /LENGTH=63 /DNA_ID=CAMNT_0010759451 /DNA_START=737 /DNA_END=928 /DNA_ORIENTATION=+
MKGGSGYMPTLAQKSQLNNYNSNDNFNNTVAAGFKNNSSLARQADNFHFAPSGSEKKKGTNPI